MFSVAKEIGESKIQEGVVSCQVGPAYETVAEMKLFQAAGVDALGMSTVYEVMAARQVGIKEKAPLTRSFPLSDKRIDPTVSLVARFRL